MSEEWWPLSCNGVFEIHTEGKGSINITFHKGVCIETSFIKKRCLLPIDLCDLVA